MSPIYEYECANCGHEYEELSKIENREVSECPECGGEEVVILPSVPSTPSGLSTPGPGHWTPEDEGFQEEWDKLWEEDD